MAKLSDYGINIDQLENSAVVNIQGKDLPISLTMETLEYIADIYGGDYSKFENDMNDMIARVGEELTSSTLTPSDLKIMRTLIYGMLKTGGLDEDSDTIFKFLGMNNNVLTIYSVCMQIFSSQTFQVEDLKKSGKPQDFLNHQKAKKAKRKKIFQK